MHRPVTLTYQRRPTTPHNGKQLDTPTRATTGKAFSLCGASTGPRRVERATLHRESPWVNSPCCLPLRVVYSGEECDTQRRDRWADRRKQEREQEATEGKPMGEKRQPITADQQLHASLKRHSVPTRATNFNPPTRKLPRQQTRTRKHHDTAHATNVARRERQGTAPTAGKAGTPGPHTQVPRGGSDWNRHGRMPRTEGRTLKRLRKNCDSC